MYNQVQSCKLYYNKIYMVASTQIKNTEIFAFIAAPNLSKLLSRKMVFINRKDNRLLKSRLVFKEIVNFTGKLLQNYKLLESKIFKSFLKHVSNHFSVIF